MSEPAPAGCPVFYLDPIAAAIGEHIPNCPPDLLRLYALLALTKGTDTTRRDVHDAWAVWRKPTDPTHLWLVPFDQLSAEVQELDVPYVDAIRTVAAGLPLAADDRTCPAQPRPALPGRTCTRPHCDRCGGHNPIRDKPGDFAVCQPCRDELDAEHEALAAGLTTTHQEHT